VDKQRDPARKPTEEPSPPLKSAKGLKGRGRFHPADSKSPRRGTIFHRLVAHRRDLRFLLLFGFFVVLYYAVTLTSFAEEVAFPWYLRVNAQASATILSTLGQQVTLDGHTLHRGGFAIEVRRGCDAVDPSALFVAAVLASPVPWLSRLCAAVGGTIALMLLNLVRIVSLFLIGVYFPSAFDVMHLDVWQAIFIFLAILLWALWASRAARSLAVQPDAAA
jgi:exosortase H (IPTLxxWG-CTERM-specific)